MQIEQLIAANTAALEANTAALNSLIAASGSLPTVTVPAPVEAPKSKGGRPPKSTPAPEPESETPTKVSAPAPESNEFSDPLDPETTVVPGTGTPALIKVNVDAVIAECVDTFKNMMLTADPERKNVLKEAFPKLREKWGLKTNDKLIVLADQPEKLVGLLADIKNL